MADADALLAAMAKNSKEELRISRTVFKGFDLISLRVFYQAEDGSMRPGKAGLAIRREKLRDLIDALSKAERLVSSGGAS